MDFAGVHTQISVPKRDNAAEALLDSAHFKEHRIGNQFITRGRKERPRSRRALP
jgi:hypothetical protein